MSEPVHCAAHSVTVHFEGETEYLVLKCHLSTSDRPCAVISCPVDHEDTGRDCIEKHGAKALDECWAESWYENGGRESLNTEALSPITIPVEIYFDDGVVAENV